MINAVAQNWWMLALRGLVAVLFGIATFIWPGLTLFILVLLFGAYAFVDGIFSLVAAFSDKVNRQRWWVLLIEGLVSIAAGILTFLCPGMTAFVLLYLIAAWAIVTGVLEVIAAVRLRKEIEGEWLLAASGILSIIFGIVMMIWPGAGALAVVWLIGSYALVFGVLMISLALRLRNWNKSQTGEVAHRPGAT